MIRRRPSFLRALALAAIPSCVAACVLGSCQGSGTVRLPDYPGIEDQHVLDGVRGTIVWVDRWSARDRLQVRDLVSGSQRSIAIDGYPDAISGPDENGDVALLDRGGMSSGHRIELVSTKDGKARTAFEGESAIHWGSAMDLAPRGGRIALLRDLVLSWNPWGFHGRKVELVVVSPDGTAPLHVSTEDDVYAQPRWFPDGQRLAYARSRPNAPVETWILDVATGHSSRLAEGAVSALSVDGSIAIVAIPRPRVVEKFDPGETPQEAVLRNALSPRFELRVVDVETGNVREGNVEISANFDRFRGPVLAIIGVDPLVVLHEGFPPRGWEQRMPDGVVGPGAQYPIRLTDPQTTRSAVVLPQTFQWPFSYGSFEGAPVGP